MSNTKIKRNSIQLGADLSLKVPLAIGTLQWGTTPLDQNIINSKGCISESTARDIVRELSEANVTLFDTAEGYGGGTSEKRLGRCTTAVTASSPPSQPPPSFLLVTKFLPTPWRYSHTCFENALRASLRRLDISCCPIYFLHSPVHWRPIEYWVNSAAICRRKGLLLSLGLSNCNADQVRRAVIAGREYGVPVTVNQVLFNLMDYNSDNVREMKRVCDEMDVTVLAYSVIGQGLLTDGLRKNDFQSNRTARIMNLDWDSLRPLREGIKRIADEHGKRSMAQVCVNWCIAHGAVPLLGCRSLNQARDSIAALEWELSEEEVKELDGLALSRSTLDSPKWRRYIFVSLASVVMVVCRTLDWLGFGMVLEASK